ncbi:unnamed protein product [Owenia fusiformis]|uniref:Uncharacterized protein n=1 Tax=Owenia fusiformis TaxID=6347 RepID=A0A8J1UTX3_OWEFU|nr:unnamed protein product [Owenia fusiformis]
MASTTHTNDTKEEEKLTIAEKLEIIDREIRTLHEFCKNKGYKQFEIEKLAQPILKPVREANRKKWLNRFKWAGICVLILAILFYFDPAYNTLCMIGRLTSVKLILPYWDWTEVYDKSCLVYNPYFIGKQLDEDDCELCETTTSLTREENISQVEMTENFLKRDIPLIVTDAMSDWPARENFSLKYLHELHKNDPKLRDASPCDFTTNLKIPNGNHRAFLKKAASGNINNYYAHWSNCDKQAAKVLRQFYKRPYFIPPMVEFRYSNWLFVSNKFTGKRFKPLSIGSAVGVMSVVKGQFDIKLLPRPPCNETCVELTETLTEGEILVFTDNLWYLDYLPNGPGESIAIGVGGNFDEARQH